MEVTVEQMKKIEHDADAAGLSYTRMMENAGTAAAQLLQKAWSPRDLIVFCGTGNNGGDGFVLARLFHMIGTRVHIYLVDGEPKTPDAILNYEKAVALGVSTEVTQEMIEKADVLVDAIYGTGFHGQLRPAGKRACELFNRAQGLKFALDLPSGVCADTGEAAEGAIRADLTVTFHAAKPCHRLNPAQCGQTVVASIGIENLER